MTDFDAIVVGSGFGGAIVAQRLAFAHKSVLILERGDWWHRTNFEGRERQGDTLFYRNADGFPRPVGGKKFFEQAVDLRYIYSIFQDLLDEPAFIGNVAAVGGASVVYSNISERAPQRIFDRGAWPMYTNERGETVPWNYVYLSSLYDKVEGCNGYPYQIYTHVPTDGPPRYHVLKYALEQLFDPGSFALARVAVRPSVGEWHEGRRIPEDELGACRNCGYCNLGCVYGAQQNLTMNYLPRAQLAGAQIWPNKNVTRIAYNPGADRWTVYYTKSETGHFLEAIKSTSAESSVTARVLVLSAGTIGTVRILQKGQLPGISPHVGYHLSGDGDYLSGGWLPPAGTWRIDGLTSVDGYKGRVIAGITRELAQSQGWVVEDLWVPPITVGGKLIVRPHDPEWAEEGRTEDHGGINPVYIASRWKNPSLYGPVQKQLVAEYHQRGLIVAFIGEDGCDGRVLFEGDRVRISAPTLTHYQDYLEAMKSIVARLPVGTRWLETETERQEGNLFTSVHPVGTCRMAQWAGRAPDDDGGVVDGNGQVFSTTGAFKNLFICDGSVMPCAPIVNPSWTIAAIAEHMGRYLAAHFPE